MTPDTPSPTQATLPAELVEALRHTSRDMRMNYDGENDSWAALIDKAADALSTPSLTAMREALEEAADTFDKFAADLREEDCELHAQRIAVAELKAEEARAALSHSKKEDGQ